MQLHIAPNVSITPVGLIETDTDCEYCNCNLLVWSVTKMKHGDNVIAW